MNDRAPIRDRTLILRILVPGLEARLREKMKETEEEKIASNQGPAKESILDLEGVTCEPTPARNNTLWNFHCDGATYPAKLVNLPCPVELHKTHDHAAYYKSVDIAQCLIVYEDDIAMEEADETPVDGFPSYYHSGLTLKRVVSQRFAAREHKAAAPPRAAIMDVEGELLTLMEKIASNEKTKRNKVPVLTSANKVLEEVVEEIVQYEPWMDDFGRQPGGVEFDTDDQQCSLHPEVWLTPEQIQQLKDDEEEDKRKKRAAADKKEAKRTAKKLEKEAIIKGIHKKSSSTAAEVAVAAADVDEVTKAAMMNDADVDIDFLDDDILGLDLEGEDMLNLGEMDLDLS